MIFRQYYLACLSHASYLIGDESTGRAVVVDPQRDVAQYLDDAAANGLTIERVIETHFHADFLSGHLELRAATGAVISYGTAAAPIVQFAIDPLAHGQRLSLGEVELEIRHTPGHTPESISVVIYEHANDPKPYGVLTGDTLFIGDVGRPDLLTSVGVSADSLARDLYRSTREQLMTLPDETLVFPAHGAGSACGKFLSSETSSTIGDQKRTNYALQPMSEEAFITAVTEGQSLSPLYFSFAASRNKEAHPILDEAEPPRPMSVTEVLAAQRRGAVVLDTRDAATFAQGHLLGSYNVGLSGRYAEYAGGVLVAQQQIVLVCENGTEREAKNRLARIGFDNVIGHLIDPAESFVAHPHWTVTASRLTVAELTARMSDVPGLQVVDVRGPGEVAGGKITGAAEVPLPRILDRLADLDPTAPTVVYCAGGYRSMIAASVMRAAGFDNVSDLVGGYGAWAASGASPDAPTSPADMRADDPREMEAAEVTDTYLLVDVREEDEWKAGHASNAVHVPLSEVQAGWRPIDSSAPVAIICRSGNRSGKAVTMLAERGVAATNVRGGMRAWEACGKPVVAVDGAPGNVI